MTPSQYRLAAELVEMIHENFPLYGGVHAQGRYYAAILKAFSSPLTLVHCSYQLESHFRIDIKRKQY